MLAYTEAGTGPAVVLLHGFPLDRSIWEQQIAALSGRYRVILPDLPGHGGSAPVEGITIAGMASEVVALLDHLQVGRAAVAGHSMGGYVALAMVKHAPERLSGLGLIASQAGADTEQGKAGRFALAERVGREGPEPVVETLLPKLFASESDPAREQVARLIRQNPPEGIQAALYAMAGREDLQPLLPVLGLPTLVLLGEQDRLIPPDRSKSMAAQIPHAILVKVAGAGHMPMLEQPDQVSYGLLEWLELVV